METDTENANDGGASGEAHSKPEYGRAAARRRSSLVVPLAALLGAAAGGFGVHLATRAPAGGGAASPHAAHAPAAKETYYCPMHPAVRQGQMGTCPICGMNLVKEEKAAAPAAESQKSARETLAAVTIDPARQQMIGLRTAEATEGPIASRLRTVGRVEVDPTGVRRINVKVEGYVERIFVDFVGRAVRRGEPLFSLYSPSLLAAQEEYLLAARTRRELAAGGLLVGSGDDLVAAARRKLELWDVPPSAIERLDRTGAPSKSLTFVSPISGVVTAKSVVEGASLKPGDTPYEVTDLGMVWVMADAYESDLPHVRVGMPATLTLSSHSGRTFRGRVEFIDPTVDPTTRTTKVHLHFANRTGELKPEMFGEVILEGAARRGVRVPADAIIHAGTRDVVFLALGEGKFRPQVVQVGTKDGDVAEIRSGLRAGDAVVTRANFLVDSESRLRASLAAVGGR